jgi:Tol biopolymer transport system component
MSRRLLVAGLAAILAAPTFLITSAHAAVLFSCDAVTGSAVLAKGFVHDARPQSLSSGPTAPAGPAEITLASTNDAGVTADFINWLPSLSADGTRVAFHSGATNLDPADTDSVHDVYVKDLTTGDITLASTSDSGVKGTLSSRWASLSADGTRVAFLTGSNLDPADTDTLLDAYVKDLTTGDLMLASTSDTGVKGHAKAKYDWTTSLSADGTRVAFVSNATNLDPADTDAFDDVYVKNLNSGNIDVVSRSDTGAKANYHSYEPSLSPDGRTVAFTSGATNLDPADTGAFDDDVYVKNRVTGEIKLASASDTGIAGNDRSGGHPLFTDLSLSADGTKVSFSSLATNFDPRDTDSGVWDVYVKDLITGDLTLASTSDAGVKGQRDSESTAISADGTRVGFSSYAFNLDPNKATTGSDSYVKNLETGDLTMADTSDTSVGSSGSSGSFGVRGSADLTRVAFVSDARNLDPAANGLGQIYVKQMPSVSTSVDIGGCSNGQTGTVFIVDIRSYDPRPLGCPQSLGGAAGNDYPDTTPILVGLNPTFSIDWASGPNSYGVAAVNAGPTPTRWRVRLAITASPGHDTPATNQYLPAAGSGATKTRLQGKFDISALDSFNCASGVDDPLSWLSMANNGTWVAKTS